MPFERQDRYGFDLFMRVIFFRDYQVFQGAMKKFSITSDTSVIAPILSYSFTSRAAGCLKFGRRKGFRDMKC